MPRVRSLHDDREIGTSNRRAAGQAARLVGKLLTRADQLADEGDDKAASFATKAAQSAAVAGGISYDKARLSEDKATVIHTTVTADDDLKALAKMFNVTLEGTCEDLPRPELPA